MTTLLTVLSIIVLVIAIIIGVLLIVIFTYLFFILSRVKSLIKTAHTLTDLIGSNAGELTQKIKKGGIVFVVIIKVLQFLLRRKL